MGYTVSNYERETLISFNEAEGTADMTTYNQAWIRKFDRLCEENPEQFKRVDWDTQKLDGKVISKRYTFPKRFITIRTKDVKRELTEEQRARLRAFGRESRKRQLVAANRQTDARSRY